MWAAWPLQVQLPKQACHFVSAEKLIAAPVAGVVATWPNATNNAKLKATSENAIRVHQ